VQLRSVLKLKDVLIKRAFLVILLLGVLLRVKHFLENRSFWLDEACTAVSVASRGFAEILLHKEVLPEFAHPPMFFMLIGKALTVLFGNNEMSLRLFPFVCGLAALFAFYILSRKVLSGVSFLMALFLFALAEPLVYYSAELKQYSLDLLLGILLLLYTEHILKDRISWARSLQLAVIGGTVIWFSNASLFTLAAMAVVLTAGPVMSRRPADLGRLGLSLSAWGISSLLLYHLSLGQMVGNTALKNTWKGAFLSGPLFSMDGMFWLWKVLGESFSDPAGFIFPVFVLGLFAAGFYAFFKKDPSRAFLYFLPIFFTLLAAVFGKYPFRGRVILFLVPCYYIFVGLGISHLAGLFGPKGRWAAFCMAAVLLLVPLKEAGAHFLTSRDWVHNREALQFFADHYEPGDLVFMNTSAQPPFFYYAGSLRFGLALKKEMLGRLNGEPVLGMRVGKFARYLGSSPSGQFVPFRYEYQVYDGKGLFRAIVGTKEPAGMVFEGGTFNGSGLGRVWLFLSKAPEDDDRIMNNIIRDAFDKGGKRLLANEHLNAAVYLYDMGR
jgi:hypothetical protein